MTPRAVDRETQTSHPCQRTCGSLRDSAWPTRTGFSFARAPEAREDEVSVDRPAGQGLACCRCPGCRPARLNPKLNRLASMVRTGGSRCLHHVH